MAYRIAVYRMTLSIFVRQHVCSSWQDFNRYSASRGPSAIAELLVIKATADYSEISHGTTVAHTVNCLSLLRSKLCWRVECCVRHNRFPSTVDGLIDYVRREFGNATFHDVLNDEDNDWYLDDGKLVSILIFDWVQQNGPGRLKLVRRNTNMDRSVTPIVVSDYSHGQIRKS